MDSHQKNTCYYQGMYVIIKLSSVSFFKMIEKKCYIHAYFLEIFGPNLFF